MDDDLLEAMIEFLPRLRRFAYALTGDSDLGDDLVQDACERALSRVEQWRPGTSLESWMFRIAQNLWRDVLRSKRVQLTEPIAEGALEIVGVDGRQVVHERALLRAVSTELARLPEDQSMVIALVCVDGRSYKEAAAILEIPVGTVMSRLARARKALHAELGLGQSSQREETPDGQSN